MSEIVAGERVKMISHSPVHGLGEIKTGDEGVVTHIDEDGYWVDFEEQSGWRGTRDDLESLTPNHPNTRNDADRVARSDCACPGGTSGSRRAV